MKVLFCVLGAIALAQAMDYSKLYPMDFVIADGETENFDNRHLINYNERIVGGEEVEPNSIPYQVALMIRMKGDDRVAFCGGSLISENYVLTAAHCTEPAESIEVVLAAHRIREVEAQQVRMVSTEFFHHKDWSRFTLRNDIALVKLPQPIQLNKNIQLAKLPSKADAQKAFEEEAAVASGWGKDSDKAEGVSPVLRSVEVPVLDNKTCNKSFFGVIHDSHICTKSTGGKSTCSGDSGGPLVHKESGKQVGLVSFGISFGCELGWPAAYTRLTYFLDWIEENSDCKIADN